MFTLIFVMFMSNGNLAVSTESVSGFSTYQSCEQAGQRALKLANSRMQAFASFTCVEVK